MPAARGQDGFAPRVLKPRAWDRLSRCSIIRRHVRGRKMKPQSTRPTAERVEDNIQCNLDNSTAELVRLLEECSEAQPTEAAIRQATPSSAKRLASREISRSWSRSCSQHSG